jgi:hypothetical protein
MDHIMAMDRITGTTIPVTTEAAHTSSAGTITTAITPAGIAATVGTTAEAAGMVVAGMADTGIDYIGGRVLGLPAIGTPATVWKSMPDVNIKAGAVCTFAVSAK